MEESDLRSRSPMVPSPPSLAESRFSPAAMTAQKHGESDGLIQNRLSRASASEAEGRLRRQKRMAPWQTAPETRLDGGVLPGDAGDERALGQCPLDALNCANLIPVRERGLAATSIRLGSRCADVCPDYVPSQIRFWAVSLPVRRFRARFGLLPRTELTI